MLACGKQSFLKTKLTNSLCNNTLQSFNYSKKENIFSYLNERNSISCISNTQLLNSEIDVSKIFNCSNPRMYIGFDPTASSLHLGNLIGILTGLRFAAFNIEPVFLLGGATGLIGDPTLRTKERDQHDRTQIEENLHAIKDNLLLTINNVEKHPDFKKFFHSKNQKSKQVKVKLPNYNETSSTGSDEESIGFKNIPYLVNRVHGNTKLYNNETPYDILKNIALTSTNSNRKVNNQSKEVELKYKVVNNIEFYKNLNIIDFLSEVGTNLRMGPLLSRETVKNRLNNKESGLSLCEFMYQTFQGYDFLKLNEKYNVKIQAGGSDQWGNMLAGYELIKKMKNDDVINVTFPLLTTASGQKFGKSEGNALFLNPKLTPINNIYQYFFNTQDSELENLFYSFTFLEKEEIKDILFSHSKKPEAREAQKILAEKLVGILYSEEEALKCKMNSQVFEITKLFNNTKDVNQLSKPKITDKAEFSKLISQCSVNKTTNDYVKKVVSLSKLCVDHKIIPTRAEFKRLLESGAVYVNNEKINSDLKIEEDILIFKEYIILKIGKKKLNIFQFCEPSTNSEETVNVNDKQEFNQNIFLI